MLSRTETQKRTPRGFMAAFPKESHEMFGKVARAPVTDGSGLPAGAGEQRTHPERTSLSAPPAPSHCARRSCTPISRSRLEM
jgi:hypothetical protein